MPDKMYPKISIVTPNFNGEKYLEETILSVLDQKYPNLEYIIIDGGSSDRSIDIIKKYEKELSYWISEPDKGMYFAIQKGFEKSTGEIMAWLNSDDMYHRNSLFSVAEIFMSFKYVKWLTGHNTNFDENGRVVSGRPSYRHNKYNMFLCPNEHIQQESTFWRRSLWVQVGEKLALQYKYAGDFNLWMKFFRYEELYITEALLGGFRYRTDQITQLYTRQYNDECKQVLEKEKRELSFFEKCNLNDIQRLKRKKRIQTLSVKEYKLLQDSIDKIMGKIDLIQFDSRQQTYIMKDKELDIKTIYQGMNTRRENLSDFLYMIKEKHKYYPEVILDVGVANGTPALYEVYPSSHFILFEALDEYLPQIQKLKNDLPKVDIEMCAVGAKNEKCKINVHPDFMGSSLYMEMEDSAVNGYTREISVKKLDTFNKKYNLNNQSILLKVDVQGAEIDVLNGAKSFLNQIDIIILEVSFFDFFNNNIEFSDVVLYMKKYNFVVYDMFGFLNRPLDESLAQVDIAFVKKDSFFRSKQYFATSEQRELLNKSNDKMGQVSTIDSSEKFNFSKQFNNFYENIKQLQDNDLRYLIYGAGTIGQTVHKLLGTAAIAFVDQSSKLMGKDIDNEKVYAVENIKNMDFDKIIITVFGREESILQTIIEECDISIDKIIIMEM